MRRVHPGLRLVAAVLVLAFVVTACGGNKGKLSSDAAVKPGGTFRIASSADVDYIDPGQIYYTFSQMLFRVMVRTLVNYPALPGAEGNKLVPDMATSTGTVSSDGLTYEFVIKDGVKYQPDTAGGRQVKSEDIRYGIERGFYPSVANGYANLYFKDLFVGDEDFVKAPKPGTHIKGIDVSSPNKIIFHLKKPTGDFLYRLALPLTAPVPEEYAKSYDAKTQSDYGQNFASSGPYQLERTGGKVTGYTAGKKIRMVRNPNWVRETDTIRKALPNEYEVIEGYEDASAATEKILNGDFDYNGDFTVPPEKLETILSNPLKKDQLHINTTNCFRYVALNTAIPPFNNPKLRQAVAYILDRNGMRLTRGGKRLGEIATHVLIPGINGFEEAGGVKYDPFPSPDFAGDLNKAQDLMRQAGFPDGKFHGDPVYMVGGNSGVAPKTTRIVQDSLAKLGINVRREDYKGNIMYTKYASVPAQKVQVLPNVAWCWDYPDSYTVIGALFDGRKITPTANNNYSQINDTALNALIDSAYAKFGPDRAKAWAEADKKVTELAAVIPWLWDNSANLISKRVRNYQFTLSSASIDLAVAGLDQGGK
ncbi:MAG: ABC transporter substrate-binding protein [Actinomycetota bacterium]